MESRIRPYNLEKIKKNNKRRAMFIPGSRVVKSFPTKIFSRKKNQNDITDSLEN